MMREWYSAAELAALRLQGMPADVSNIRKLARRDGWDLAEHEGRRWRQRAGRGGGIEYHYSVLPPLAQTALVAREGARDAAAQAGKGRSSVDDQAALQLRVDALWAAYDRLPAEAKRTAERRLAALNALAARLAAGEPRTTALATVAAAHAVSVQTLRNWEALTHGLPRPAWLAALVKGHGGGAPGAECSPEAWEWVKGDWLRNARPTFSSCYRRLQREAARQGWTIPSEKTLWRRVQSLSHTTKVKERDGREALERMLPAQRRDRSVYKALEAVNCDAHTFDVFVRWPGRDKPVRPVLYGVQDVFSGMLLGYRIDLSENTQTIRLALMDVAERWGIPRIYWFDNTLAAANKQITGGAAHRFRYKIKEEDPQGLIVRLGGEVHFTTTYHGQAKPVERAFRDLAQDWAKDPRFHGAYTGNNPMAKPADYGSRAIPLDLFRTVLAELCEEHNARPGRRSMVAQGRSLLETFEASYRETAEAKGISRLTEVQRRFFLMQAEVHTIRREQPMLHLYGGRYFAEWMLQMPGTRVIARFDPDALDAGVEVYGLDERYLGDAERLEDSGYNSTAEAREWSRWKKRMRENTAERADMEKGRSIREIAAAMERAPKPDAAAAPEVKVLRPVFQTHGNAALKPYREEEEGTDQNVVLDALRAFQGRQKRP